MNNQIIIIFMRAPELGAVKTRLAKDVGDARALELYRRFVQRMVDGAAQSGIPWQICFCPPEGGAAIEAWLGGNLDLLPQVEGDLGARMASALAHAFDGGAEKAVLVGTDIPGVTAGDFHRAFDRLGKGDAVLGPTVDGGYWLIGFTRQGFRSGVFENMAWSTSDVADQTREAFRTLGLTFGELSPLRDIDTLADLQAFDRETS